MVPKSRDKAQNRIYKREENPANNLGASWELVCSLLVIAQVILDACPPGIPAVMGAPACVPPAPPWQGRVCRSPVTIFWTLRHVPSRCRGTAVDPPTGFPGGVPGRTCQICMDMDLTSTTGWLPRMPKFLSFLLNHVYLIWVLRCNVICPRPLCAP